MYRIKQEQKNNNFDSKEINKNIKLELVQTINNKKIKFTLINYEFSYLILFIANMFVVFLFLNFINYNFILFLFFFLI